MKIEKMLKEGGYFTKPEKIAEIIGSPIADISLGDPITPCPGHDLTIWPWEDDNGNHGFLRDDSAGFSSVCIDDSRDDQLRLAAWNADFDIKILNLDEEVLVLALEDARENQWGFPE
jgi:hypothetical protein